MIPRQFGPMMRIGVALYHAEDAARALREYWALYPTLPRSVGYHAALKHDMPALPYYVNYVLCLPEEPSVLESTLPSLRPCLIGIRVCLYIAL